ncbi:hypothetical protein [Powai lake megavirus]|uniref:Uncharacterized protein n=1 Tax=Powai lake megavirus TaxID=1842663 RepID=A0A167RQI2_9VIRU|nr:hypothetical protein QJ849_gp851 [Powai lake megavirus]ANB51013.1 hypothetical protein [Powai lake megavirus]
MNQYGLCYVKCDNCTSIINDRMKCQKIDSDIYQIINSAISIIARHTYYRPGSPFRPNKKAMTHSLRIFRVDNVEKNLNSEIFIKRGQIKCFARIINEIDYNVILRKIYNLANYNIHVGKFHNVVKYLTYCKKYNNIDDFGKSIFAFEHKKKFGELVKRFEKSLCDNLPEYVSPMLSLNAPNDEDLGMEFNWKIKNFLVEYLKKIGYYVGVILSHNKGGEPFRINKHNINYVRYILVIFNKKFMDDLINSIRQIDNFNNGNKYDIIKTYVNGLNMKDKMGDKYSYLSEMHLSEYLFDYFNVKKMNSITKSFISGYKNYYFVKEFCYEVELDRIIYQESFDSIDFDSIDD